MASILNREMAAQKRDFSFRSVALKLTQIQNLLQSDSLGGRLLSGTLWSGAASVLSQVPSLVISVLLGRVLGMAVFGQLAIIQTMVVILSGVGDLGLVLATTRYVAARRSDAPPQASRIIGFSICATLFSAVMIATVVIWSAPWYTRTILHTPELSIYLQGACLFLVLEMLNRIQLGVLAGLEAFQSTACVNALRGLFLLFVPVAAYFRGLSGAIFLLTCMSAATCAGAQLMLRRICSKNSIPIRWDFKIPDTGLVRLAGSLWLSILMLNLTTWFSTVILVRQRTGIMEMALFTAADKWKTAILFLPTVLAQVTTPLIAHTYHAGNRRGCMRILSTSAGVSGGVTVLLVAAIAACGHLLMSAYGWTGEDAVKVLVVACLGCVPMALYAQGSAAYWTMSHPKNMLAVDGVRYFLLMLLVAAGLGRNAVLLAAANGLSITGAGLLLLILIRKILRNTPVECATSTVPI